MYSLSILAHLFSGGGGASSIKIHSLVKKDENKNKKRLQLPQIAVSVS